MAFRDRRACRQRANENRTHPGNNLWSFFDEMLNGVPYNRESGYSQYHYNNVPEEEGGANRRDIIQPSRVSNRSVEQCNPKAVLAKCRTEIYKPIKSKGRSKARVPIMSTQDECPVCLDKFLPKQSLYRIPCNHLFHKGCLKPWIESNHVDCPCCRANILNPPPPKLSNNNVRTTNANDTNAYGSRPSRELPPPPPPSFCYPNYVNMNTRSITPNTSARREPNDIMSILDAMEAAMDRWGLRTY